MAPSMEVLTPMSSEPFEEREEAGEAGVELVERGEEGEEVPPVEGEALEEEPTLLYDVTKPEILEIMMNTVEILSDASEGAISFDDAKKLYRAVERKLREQIKAGTIIKKPKTRRARKEKKPKEAKKPKPKEEKPKKKPPKKKPKTKKTSKKEA